MENTIGVAILGNILLCQIGGDGFVLLSNLDTLQERKMFFPERIRVRNLFTNTTGEFLCIRLSDNNYFVVGQTGRTTITHLNPTILLTPLPNLK